MAPKPKVKKPVVGAKPKEPTTSELLFVLDEDRYYHEVQLQDHEHRIGSLEADLTGRDKLIWAVLDQHNSRIAALKHGPPPEPEDPKPVGVVVSEEEAPLWFIILFWFGIFAIVVAAGYMVGRFHP